MRFFFFVFFLICSLSGFAQSIRYSGKISIPNGNIIFEHPEIQINSENFVDLSSCEKPQLNQLFCALAGEADVLRCQNNFLLCRAKYN